MAFLSKLFGKKDKDNEKKDEAELPVEAEETDDESEELTEEEIAAAEKF